MQPPKLDLDRLRIQISQDNPDTRMILTRYHLSLMVKEIEQGRQDKAKLKRIHEMTRQ